MSPQSLVACQERGEYFAAAAREIHGRSPGIPCAGQFRHYKSRQPIGSRPDIAQEGQQLKMTEIHSLGLKDNALVGL
jgi:hypothetical protein